MILLKLAFRNIQRNRRRSLITIIAVGVGLASLIFLWSFNDGTNEQMRDNVIRLFTSHVQIHAHGFQKLLDPALVLPDRVVIEHRLKSLSELEAFSERVKTEALIGTNEQSRGIQLIGIDPVQEKKVTDLERFITHGTFLKSGDKRLLLIGNRLADKMDAQLGDKVVLMTQAMDGTLAGFPYHIAGIFDTGSQTMDELTAYITLDSAQELLGLDEEIHEIAIRLHERRQIPSFLKSLSFLNKTKYEVFRWDEIVPEVEQWSQWSESIIRTILVAVMFVIGVGIMNTVIMSVFERTREFGIMMAIGTSPKQILKLIVIETVLLELGGMILGLIVGCLLTYYFSKVGIAFHELEQAFSRSYMSTVTYTRLEWTHVAQSLLILFAMNTLIGLYPAWKASRMEPIQAIYRP